MSKLLYNYSALVIEVTSPSSVTALVDHGFRSWSMRQFRLPGVTAPDPRTYPRGDSREGVKDQINEYRLVLERILCGDKAIKSNVLLCPEKPSFSGHFSSQVYMPTEEYAPAYCIKMVGKHWLDVAAIMKDLCASRLTVAEATSFIDTVKPRSFV